MTVGTEQAAGPPDRAVLGPEPSVLEVPIGNEAILWGRSVVPLHLSPSAFATWCHFDGVTPLVDVIQGVADTFNETTHRVGAGVRAVAATLLDAGLLRDAGAVEPPSIEPRSGNAAPRAAAVDAPAAEWLARRAAETIDLTIGSVAVAVTANTGSVAAIVRRRFASFAPRDERTAPVRYMVIDAGTEGAGDRYWVLSETGLPLDHADAVDEVLDRLAEHLGEVLAVQSGTGVPLRLAVLESNDHCVAVQWDLLACRAVLEGPLRALGYRITSRQWAIADPERLEILPVEAVDGTTDMERGPLPLRGVVLWFGPGSLDEPRTLGEWVWSLVMMGCASVDHRPTDCQALVNVAEELAGRVQLVGLTNAGPSALVAVLADVARGERR